MRRTPCRSSGQCAVLVLSGLLAVVPHAAQADEHAAQADEQAAPADKQQAKILAPPGACAEPREALAGSGMTSSTSSFAVAGGVGALFAPADVAAPPALAQLGTPAVSGLIRPGPCDQPGAGCAPTATLSGLGGPNPPVVPGPGGRPKPD